MSSLSEKIDACVRFQHYSPRHLSVRDITPLSLTAIAALQGAVYEKQCYHNAVIAGIELDAESVVFGCLYFEACGLAIDHAWIKMPDGTEHDPAAHLPSLSLPEGESLTYFSLIEVELGEYLDFADSLGLSEGQVITNADLRRNRVTKHLFMSNHER